jgi:hypothetical protein
MTPAASQRIEKINRSLTFFNRKHMAILVKFGASLPSPKA